MRFEFQYDFSIEDERLWFHGSLDGSSTSFWIGLHTMDSYFGPTLDEDYLAVAMENSSLIAEVAECYARLNPEKTTIGLGVRDLTEIRLALLPDQYRK